MKIRMFKKATVFLIAIVLVILTAPGAFAVSYYDAGKSNYTEGYSAIKFFTDTDTNTRYMQFLAGNQITGPNLDSVVGKYQNITGLYSLGTLIVEQGTTVTTGKYDLALVSGGSLNVQNQLGTATYLEATAQAMQIDFGNNTIKWYNDNKVALTSTINPGTSAALLEMKDIQTAGGIFKFSAFAFDHTDAVNTWLNTAAGTDVKSYSRLEGVSATPEPAEWVLMFIGLGMLGFYLQRRGYLNFDLSPQSVA